MPTPTPSLGSPVTVQTLDRAEAQDAGPVQLVYDLSQPILAEVASYTAAAPGPAWTVVAECRIPKGNKGTALGVIPTTAVTPAIQRKAEAGGFRRLLVECR